MNKIDPAEELSESKRDYMNPLEASARMIADMSMEQMSEDHGHEGGDKVNKVKDVKAETTGKDEKPEDPAVAEAKKKAYEAANKKAKELLGMYISKYKGLMLLGLFLNILGMVGEFISPLFIGWVIDAIVKKDFKEVQNLVVWWLIINSSSAVFAGIQRFVFQLTTEKIGYDIRQDLFEEIVKKDIAFFDSRKTGDLSKLNINTLFICFNYSFQTAS